MTRIAYSRIWVCVSKGPFRNQKMPGMYASCVRWLKQRDMALLGSDGVQDVRPSGVQGVDQPVHALCLNAVGTLLMDNCDLEGLSRAASERGRWAFCFTMAPCGYRVQPARPPIPLPHFESSEAEDRIG